MYYEVGFPEYTNEARTTNIIPIPITPEWLERFGLKLNSTGEICELNNTINIRNYTGEWCLFMDDWMVPDIKQISYVHQLQNLYFALTGTEL